jgi:hypothetical protein
VLHGGERTGEFPVATVALISEPRVLRSPEDLLGAPRCPLGRSRNRTSRTPLIRRHSSASARSTFSSSGSVWLRSAQGSCSVAGASLASLWASHSHSSTKARTQQSRPRLLGDAAQKNRDWWAAGSGCLRRIRVGCSRRRRPRRGPLLGADARSVSQHFSRVRRLIDDRQRTTLDNPHSIITRDPDSRPGRVACPQGNVNRAKVGCPDLASERGSP